MEIFRKDGHLAPAAISALAQNAELDELARLEIAEHLAYCDLCLQRYTNALTDAALLAPLQSCRESIWQRIRARTLHVLTSRYATAVAAVVLALTLLWGGGDLLDRAELPQDAPSVTERVQTLWDDSVSRAKTSFNDFFDGLKLP